MVSLNSLSLRRKIFISAALITFIPLIVLLYYFGGFEITPAAVGIVAVLILLGWIVIFLVVKSILAISSHTKETLKQIGEDMPPAGANEVMGLEDVMEKLAHKVKTNLEELQDFSKKTEQLNKEIAKKVFILSTILEANNLFYKEAREEDVIRYLSQQVKDVLELDFCFCLLRTDVDASFVPVASIGMEAARVMGIVGKYEEDLALLKDTVKLDSRTKGAKFYPWLKELAVENIILVPIISRNDLLGILGIASGRKDFIFSREVKDTLHLFSQNVLLFWGHKRLAQKVEALEVTDYLTGLYNEKFILARLSEEVTRCAVYQRPCGFLLMQIIDYDAYQAKFGVIEAEKLLCKIADIFRQSLRTIDLAARVDVNRLGAILIERNRRQSRHTARDLKEKLQAAFKGKVKMVFAVAESPMNGINAQELISFAQAGLEAGEIL